MLIKQTIEKQWEVMNKFKSLFVKRSMISGQIIQDKIEKSQIYNTENQKGATNTHTHIYTHINIYKLKIANVSYIYENLIYVKSIYLCFSGNI